MLGNLLSDMDGVGLIILRNFNDKDADILKKYLYQELSLGEIKNMIKEWEKREYFQKYFEMFAIISKDIVGTVSLSEHSKSVISCGIEVFSEFKRSGIGKEAMMLAMDIAKEKGYKIVLDQVRVDNAASVALHYALGFESDNYVYINKRGREVNIFLKPLW